MSKTKLNVTATVEEVFKDFLVTRETKGLADKTLTSFQSQFQAIARHLDVSMDISLLQKADLGQHRTIAEASAVESPIRQETIGFPAHFFARAHNFKPPGRACQPEADSPMRT